MEIQNTSSTCSIRTGNLLSQPCVKSLGFGCLSLRSTHSDLPTNLEKPTFPSSPHYSVLYALRVLYPLFMSSPTTSRYFLLKHLAFPGYFSRLFLARHIRSFYPFVLFLSSGQNALKIHTPRINQVLLLCAQQNTVPFLLSLYLHCVSLAFERRGLAPTLELLRVLTDSPPTHLTSASRPSYEMIASLRCFLSDFHALVTPGSCQHTDSEGLEGDLKICILSSGTGL